MPRGRKPKRGRGGGKAVRQAGAVPFRVGRDGRVRVLLVTTSNGGWGMPKGTIEPGDTARVTAAKESHEEAGVRGRVGRRAVGEYEYRKEGRRLRVRVFPLRVSRLDRRWPEQDRRERRWASLSEARRVVEPAGLREVLARIGPAELRDDGRH